MVGGRPYDTYKEAVEAQDRRFEAFLRCGGAEAEEDLALRVAPDDATPGTYNPEPSWPISAAIDEVFAERFPLFTGSALNGVAHETRYLIPGILAVGQTSAMLGPFKTLKTSLALDLAIALASGTPFLGRFPVAETGRVLFLAGDAGLPALQAKARRICSARGLSLAALENLVICPQVAAARQFVRPDGSGRTAAGAETAATGDRSGRPRAGRQGSRQRRSQRGAANVGRADAVGRCGRLHGAHRAAFKTAATGRRSGHARRISRQWPGRVRGAVAAGRAASAVRRRRWEARAVAHHGQPDRRPGPVGDRRRRNAGDGQHGRSQRERPPLADGRAGSHVVRHASRRRVGGRERRSALASPGTGLRTAVPANARNVDGVPRRLHVIATCATRSA